MKSIKNRVGRDVHYPVYYSVRDSVYDNVRDSIHSSIAVLVRNDQHTICDSIYEEY